MSIADTKTADVPLVWNCQLERYFAKTGEQAQCLSILHGKCEELYSARKVYIDLPVFIGSGVIGFLNAASTNIFQNQYQLSSVALGVGSLCVGVLNTIGSYFGWAKRAEGHRISQIQYSRLYRFLSIEMSLQRENRMSPKDLLKYTRDSYDRLQEISPPINSDVQQAFKRQFKKYTNVAKPEGTNGLETISVFQEMHQMDTLEPSEPLFIRTGTLRGANSASSANESPGGSPTTVVLKSNTSTSSFLNCFDRFTSKAIRQAAPLAASETAPKELKVDAAAVQVVASMYDDEDFSTEMMEFQAPPSNSSDKKE
jgi:hypothetical protein